MNWHKTKTIFIICFLLLDIFLGYQMYQRLRENQEQLNNFQKSNPYESSRTVNIPREVDIPSIDGKMYFIKGTFVNFKEDDEAKKGLKKIQGDHPEISFTTSANGQILNAVFTNDRQKIQKPKTTAEMQAFLKTFVYKGDLYKHWPTTNDKDKVIHFVQMVDGNPLYSVSVNDGDLYMLNVYTDGDLVTGYQQVLIKTTKQNPVKVTMSGQDAIQLIADNYLPMGHNPKVTDIEIGYINLATDIEESRDLPYILAWYINVKSDQGNRAFFVTMFGKVYEYDNGEKSSSAN